MSDMTAVITPKSDQINAEDFLAGPITYTIESVEIRAGTEQPVSIRLRGEDRVWRPCKSMSRVLVAAWGPDAKAYTGRSVTLYRDPKVKWGGLEVGGIRISHLSHIERELLLSLTATKGKRTPHIVKPLKTEPAKVEQSKPTATAVDDAGADEAARQGMAAYKAFVGALPKDVQRGYVATEAHAKRKEIATQADASPTESEAIAMLTAATDWPALQAVWDKLPTEICDHPDVSDVWEKRRAELTSNG